MADSIQVRDLGKTFSYYEKEVGIRSSLKNLFHREKLLKTAVDRISFDIQEGGIVGFLGPNGAGKTTTLKMLSGILVPTEGEAKVLGFTPWERKIDFKRQIAIVMGQKSQLWWDLPANETFYYNKCMYEIGDAEYRRTLDELVEMLGVQEVLKVQVRRLSLGERMKMELIASLLHHPKVVFLDEPTIGLDLISQRKMREFLKAYHEKYRATVILTSHYMQDIQDLCRRVIVINRGTLVYDGDLAQINHSFQNRKIVKVRFHNDLAEELARLGQVLEEKEEEITLEAERENLPRITEELMAHGAAGDFVIEDIPIERGIERLYERKESREDEDA